MTQPHPTCPDCGAPLPADSPQSLCPACLLKQAMASRTIVAGVESPPPPPPPAPEEIADKFPQFEVTECLGSGGMGVVYKARQKSLDRWVAIKILRPEKTGDERFAERFAREAQTLARLNHPNIVTVFDYGETSGLYYIVMEFVDGVNLRDLLREGKLEPEQALAIVPPICEALQYAHEKGIVHRDIKPENLLLDRDGRIKIADFGIASLVGAAGEAAGTPPYMAPEQFGPGKIDHRADIYALGVVLYEMLTGERPAKDTVVPFRKGPDGARLHEMVKRAMNQDPEKRYQTVSEFRTVMEKASSPPPAPASHPATAMPPAPATHPAPASHPAPPAKRGAFARLWWLFLVMIPVGILLGAFTGFIAAKVVPKKYEASTIIQVRLQPGETFPGTSLATWMEAIRSRKSLDEVGSRLNLAKSWEATDEQVLSTLQAIINLKGIPGTSLIKIDVRYTDPVKAAEIANTLAQVMSSRTIRDSFTGDLVSIHENAVTPLNPVSPNVTLLIGTFAAAGLVLSPLMALLLILLLSRRSSGCLTACLLLILLGAVGAVAVWGIAAYRSHQAWRAHMQQIQ